jgi:Kef-type K+ transport system membrane component KefB
MSILNQITIIFIASVFFGAILKFLKQPIFLAHIIVGLFVGSYFLPNFELRSNNQYFEIITSLLLFIGGLTVNLKHFKELGEFTIVKNSLAFLLISIVFYFGLTFLGFEVLESITLALAISLSSVVILNKVATDDYLHRNLFNKIAQTHLLVQTLFLTLILVFLNSFTANRFETDFYETLINNTLKTLILIANLYLFSRYFITRIEKFIVTSSEFLFIFVIGFGFTVVSLFKFLNLSYELGALLAGIMLSIHAFSFELLSRLKVIRELVLLGFFVFLGAGLDFNVFSDKFLLVLILVLLVLVIKVVINLFVERLFRTPVRDNFFSSISLVSLSEFSIVIVLLAVTSGILNYEIFSVLGFTYIILAVLNIYFIKHRVFIYDKYFDLIQIFKSKHELNEKLPETDVVLIGCGKLGFDFLESYKYLKNKFLVIDYDFDVLNKLKKLKINNYYGDISDMSVFESLPYLKSKLIYSSIADSEINAELLRRLKIRKYSGVKIVVSYSYSDTLEFYRLGADYVVMPEYISGKFVADLTLNFGFDSKKYLVEKSSHLDSLKIKENHSF